ncbi:MAG: hypothetical protein AAGC55_02525 [Myxococcota bacterium]
MDYRIMEVKQHAPDSLDGAIEIGQYDSAYKAMEHMMRVFVQRGQQPPPWYLIDPFDQILMGPDDLYDVAA